MLRPWNVQVACKIAVIAVLLGGLPFLQAQGQRFPPRISGSSKLHGKLRTRTGYLSERGSGHDRKPAFLVSSDAGNKVAHRSSSQSSDPSAASLTGHQAPPQQQQSSLASGLSMLSIVIGHVRLREIFRRRGWSFPSSVAGMLGLLAGLVGLDSVAPRQAERAARALEAGSAQFSAWLPVLFVPALLPWVRAEFRIPLAEILGASGSLPEALVTAAKMAARRAAAMAASDYTYMHEDRLPSPSAAGAPAKARHGGGGRFRVRLAANVACLVLSVAGGWLVSFRSAAAVFPALSSSSSPSSTSAAAPTSAASLSRASSATTADVGSFGGRFVRRLGVGAVASGVMSGASFLILNKNMPSVNARLKEVVPVSDKKTLEKKLSSPEGRAEMEEALGLFPLLSLTGYAGAYLSMGLATLFGFAAGHAGVRPGRVFSSRSPVSSPCPPWKAALFPVVASAAATAVASAALNLADAGFPHYVCEDSGLPGAGDLLMSLRGPAVLSFAAPLYRMRGLMFSNARQVLGGSIFCASAALITSALASRLLGVPKAFKKVLQESAQAEAIPVTRKLENALRSMSPWEKHKLLPPKPTSVAAALGSYATPAIAGVLFLAGVLGATIGARILGGLGVTDKMAQGLIQGGISNVLGVAAAAPGHPDGLVVATTTGGTASARDVSTVAMILTGAAGVALMSVPPVRSALLSIALGSSVATAPVPLSAAESIRWRRRADGGPFGIFG